MGDLDQRCLFKNASLNNLYSYNTKNRFSVPNKFDKQKLREANIKYKNTEKNKTNTGKENGNH